ncbi:hypothetical protein P9112_012686 [Eukaryota sp. TZLM1-RC]
MALHQALEKAHLAVSADQNGQYTEALTFYESSVSLIEDAMSSSSSRSQVTLNRYKNTYLKRIDVLKQQLSKHPSELTEDGFHPPSAVPVFSEDLPSYCQAFDVPFFKISTPNIDPLTITPPINTISSPFWFLRLLSTSIRTGGPLTKTIYIPRIVWYQSDSVKSELIPSALQQISFFSKVGEHSSILARSLSRLEADSDKGLAVEHYLSHLTEFKDQLSQFFPYLSQSRRKKGLSKIVGKIKSKSSSLIDSITSENSSVSSAAYADALCVCGEKIVLLEDCFVDVVNRLDSSVPLFNNISLVVKLLNKTVCTLAMDSVTNLLRVYLKDVSNSFISGV